MARSFSVTAWEIMEDPGSSEDAESPDDENDELSSVSNLKRKAFPPPISRASPKRQRTTGDATVSTGSSSLHARLPQSNGTNGASAGSSSNTSRPRGSVSRPSRPSPLSNAIAGPSQKETSGAIRSSKTTGVSPSLRRSKSPEPTQLSKPVGQVKGKERSRTSGSSLPAGRSRSSGPTKILSKAAKRHEVIEITDSSDSDAPPTQSAAKSRKSVGAGPPSSIRIPSALHRLEPKYENRAPSLPAEGTEVITIDDSDEDTSSVLKPLPRPLPRADSVLKKKTTGPSKPSQPSSVTNNKLASSSKPIAVLKPSVSTKHTPALITHSNQTDDSDKMDVASSSKPIAVLKPSVSTKHTPALLPHSAQADDSDKMDVDNDANNIPSTSQSVPDGQRSINRSNITTLETPESRRRKLTPIVPLLDLRSPGKLPLPGRRRSSLPQTKLSKLSIVDTGEFRPPVLSAKSPSQATPPSAAPRRSSDLDMSGLKDVLTNAVSLSPLRRTQPIKSEHASSPAFSSSVKDLRPELHSSETSEAMLQPLSDIKGKQKEQPVSSDLNTKKEASAELLESGPSNGEPMVIDLTLDADGDTSPPLPAPRPLPPPRPTSAMKNSELHEEILAKPEPPPSPSVPRSIEPVTMSPRDVSSANATAAHINTSIRPMPLPLPTPRLRPLSWGLKKASEPAKTPSPVLQSMVEDVKPTHDSSSSSSSAHSSVVNTGYTSDGIRSGSGSASTSGSSPIEAPLPVVILPRRTARKSTRGGLSSHGLLSPSRSRPVYIQTLPSLTSTTTTKAGSSMPPSSPQVSFELPPSLSRRPDNLETRGLQTSEMMEIVTEGVLEALSTTEKSGEPNGKLANAPQNLIVPNSAAEPVSTLDDNSELEYVDDPILRTSYTEPPVETDSTEMMDVEELLTSSRPDSPIPLPETESHGSTPDLMDMIEIEEGQQLRRSTRTSLSASGEPMNLFLDDDDGFTDSASSPPASPTPPEDFSVPVPVKTFGGFQSLNWRTFRQTLRPKCYFSKDLPHTLQDTINSFSEIGRRHRSLRGVMEAAIRENTAEDEPDAPPIEIINEVDDDPTPPWEFHYSNKMWFGEDVPLPDLTKLTHCNCVGRCDPKNKLCACAQRQLQWVEGMFHTPDFLYDSKGHVKATEYPVFECNDLCGCGDECRNRVVQHGRKCAIRIQKTEEKGWGVFAGSKKILAGSFIGVYAGELLTDRVGEIRGITYNKFGRTYLFDLDFWHLKQGKEDWDIQYTVDAYHAGNFTRFLNHSCDPNCSLVSCYINDSDLQKPLLTVFAKRDIEPFEELCFSYSGDSGDGDEDDLKGDPRSSPAGDKDAVYIKCACKAKNCTGYMFK